MEKCAGNTPGTHGMIAKSACPCVHHIEVCVSEFSFMICGEKGHAHLARSWFAWFGIVLPAKIHVPDLVPI
jgi:hypothetical protein